MTLTAQRLAAAALPEPGATLAALSLLEAQPGSHAAARQKLAQVHAFVPDTNALQELYASSLASAGLPPDTRPTFPAAGHLIQAVRSLPGFGTSSAGLQDASQAYSQVAQTLAHISRARQEEQQRLLKQQQEQQQLQQESAPQLQQANPNLATRPAAPPAGSKWAQGGGRGVARLVAQKRPAVEDESDGMGDEVVAERAKTSGFQSALRVLNTDRLSKGQEPLPSSGQVQGHVPGLRRAGVGGRAGGVLKRGVMGGTTGGGEGGGSAGDAESLWSDKVLEKLADADGNMPAIVEKCDHKCVEQILHEIMDSNKPVTMDDVAGLEHAKEVLEDIIVWPSKLPLLYRGRLAPPKGVLLFGPPGTGKTLIGKAVACSLSATFFAISAASLTSKWIGEGEKMVVALFAVAECLQPSVVFVDEIDSLLSARKSEGEHESSRRLKTQFLTQMEGLDTNSDRRVLVIGATNRPEELDEAARRRFAKQLYIPLPCAAARREMVDRFFSGGGDAPRCGLSESDLQKLVAKTDGYSGSDMRNLLNAACNLATKEVRTQYPAGSEQLARIQAKDVRPVTLRDFQTSARGQKPTVTNEEIVRYEAYNQRHGVSGVSDAVQGEESEDW